MIYLASPYSHPNREAREQRYHNTQAFVAKHFGHVVLFSPIVYAHDMAKKFLMPTDAESWMEFNDHMQDIAEATWVLMLDGWRDSLGVSHEIEYAESIGQQVLYRAP